MIAYIPLPIPHSLLPTPFVGSGRERLAQNFQALRNRGVSSLFAFHFERDVAFESGVAQDLRDALVIQIARVIDAAAVVCFGLYDDRVGCKLFKLWVRIAE